MDDGQKSNQINLPTTGTNKNNRENGREREETKSMNTCTEREYTWQLSIIANLCKETRSFEYHPHGSTKQSYRKKVRDHALAVVRQNIKKAKRSSCLHEIANLDFSEDAICTYREVFETIIP